MEVLDFREFIRNDTPQLQLNELKTHSVFTTGYIIIGIACVTGLSAAIAENTFAKGENAHIAESIVHFMKIFMPITILAALAILAFMNPLL